MVDFYGIDVGEYITPMDPMGIFGMMPLPVTGVSQGLIGIPNTKEVIRILQGRSSWEQERPKIYLDGP